MYIKSCAHSVDNDHLQFLNCLLLVIIKQKNQFRPSYFLFKLGKPNAIPSKKTEIGYHYLAVYFLPA